MATTTNGLDAAAAAQLQAWAAGYGGALSVLGEGAPEPEQLEALRRAAAGGAVVVLAVPGAHGIAAARGYAETIGGTVVAAQRHVEGLLIAGVEDAVAPPLERARVHAWIVAAGGERNVATAWEEGAELARLAHANHELERANARLARDAIGRYDSAAAGVVIRAEQRAAAAEAEVEFLKGRLEQEIEAGARNDEYFQAARAKLHEPHHRFAESLHRRLSALRPRRRG